MCSIIWYTHFILFHLIENILWSDQLWADFILLQGIGICSLKNTALKYVWKMDGVSPKQSLTLTSSSGSISTSLPLTFISPSVNMVEKRKLFKVKVLVFPMETDLLSPLCHYLPTVLFWQLMILWSHNENSSVMTPGERNTIGGLLRKCEMAATDHTVTVAARAFGLYERRLQLLLSFPSSK